MRLCDHGDTIGRGVFVVDCHHQHTEEDMEAGMKAYHRGLSQDDSSDSSYMVTGDAGGCGRGEAWEAARTHKSGPFKSAQNRKLSESDGYLLVRRFAEGHFSSVAGLRVS